MKFRRASLIFLPVLALSVFLMINSAHAQAPDLGGWVGKWFKISLSGSGYCIETSALYKSPSKYTGYLKLRNWSLDEGILRADFYYYKKEAWKIVTLGLNYFSGSDLDFLFWFDGTVDNHLLSGVGQITGKENGGLITSAKFNMPSGISKDYSTDPSDPWYCMGSFSLKGSLTSAVPVPPGIISHPMTPLSFSFSPCSSGGDSITVSGVTGTSATIIPGAEYEICGTYALNSTDSAQIVAANYAPYGLVGSNGSNQNISKGSGSYCVSFTVENVEPGFEKKIGIGFYPKPSGDQFFGSGYGCSDILLQ